MQEHKTLTANINMLIHEIKVLKNRITTLENKNSIINFTSTWKFSEWHMLGQDYIMQRNNVDYSDITILQSIVKWKPLTSSFTVLSLIVSDQVHQFIPHIFELYSNVEPYLNKTWMVHGQYETSIGWSILTTFNIGINDREIKISALKKILPLLQSVDLDKKYITVNPWEANISKVSIKDYIYSYLEECKISDPAIEIIEILRNGLNF